MLVAVATVVTLSLSPISGASPLVPVYDGPVLAARQSDSAGSFAHPAINVTGEGGWGWAVKKARQAVSTLNLAEKVNLTSGIGSVGRCEGTLGRVDKLNIPELCFQDGPTGVRSSDGVTAFPAGLTTGATFNRKLMEKRGMAMAQEFKAKGINVLLGPVTGGPMGRSPWQGRNWEGFGLDPYLVGEAGYATIKGIQSQGVIATSKHFLAYEQEKFRQLYAADDPWTLNSVNNTQNTYTANVDDRTMHELYLKPFMNAVRAGVGCVMCIYNQINGTAGCENSAVMNQLLKNELDFQGFVVSDWSAVFNTTLAAHAGLDVIMPGGASTGGYRNQVGGPALIEAVLQGEVPEWRVDDMSIRFLAQYYLRGQDKDYPTLSYKDGTQQTYFDGTLVNKHRNVQDDHSKVAAQVAEEAITLIYNRGSSDAVGPNGLQAYGTGLPLTKQQKVAVFGSDAGPNPSGVNGCQGWLGRGSQLCPGSRRNNGTNAVGWGSGASYFPYLIDPLTGIQSAVKAYGTGTVDSFLDDDALEDPDNQDIINRLAQISDASLVFVQARSGEDSDRASLKLEANGDQLINMVASQSNNTILVVHTVGPIEMDEWFDHPNVTALLFPHLPGQESGSTLVKALYGEINPSGKMPYSILSTNNTDSYPQIVSDMGDDGTIPVDFSEGLFIDYRKFDRDDVQSLIPFGHGLSYTTFKHSPNLQAKAITDGSCYPNELSETSRKLAPGGLSWLWKYAVQLDAKVTNTGAWDGAEVSQLYVQFPDSVADTPRKQLVGFEKLYLKRGESKNATFKVTLRDLSYWNVEKQEFVVPDGEFVFKVGSSSADEDLQSTVKVEVKDSQVVQ